MRTGLCVCAGNNTNQSDARRANTNTHTHRTASNLNKRFGRNQYKSWERYASPSYRHRSRIRSPAQRWKRFAVDGAACVRACAFVQVNSNFCRRTGSLLRAFLVRVCVCIRCAASSFGVNERMPGQRAIGDAAAVADAGRGQFQ